MALLYTIIIITFLLSITFTVVLIFTPRLVPLYQNVRNSVSSYYVGVSAVEYCTYQRKVGSTTGVSQPAPAFDNGGTLVFYSTPAPGCSAATSDVMGVDEILRIQSTYLDSSFRLEFRLTDNTGL